MEEARELFETFRNLLLESMRKGIYLKMDEFKLTFLQRNIIILIDRHGEMKMTDLGKLLAVQKPAMTRLIDNLEKRNFVKRTNMLSDRRGYKIVLTDKSRNILKKLDEQPIKTLHKILSDTPEQKRLQLKDCLEKFLQRLKETKASLN